MELLEITTTKQLKAIFPELARTNKFKRKIDEILKAGFVFKLRRVNKASEYLTYGNQAGQNKVRLTHVMEYKGKSSPLRSYKTEILCASMPEIEKIREKGLLISVSNEVAMDETRNGVKTPLYSYKALKVTNMYWDSILYSIGKLIEKEVMELENCSKCGGSGILPHYRHYAKGVCFECLGIGKWIVVKEGKVNA